MGRLRQPPLEESHGNHAHVQAATLVVAVVDVVLRSVRSEGAGTHRRTRGAAPHVRTHRRRRVGPTVRPVRNPRPGGRGDGIGGESAPVPRVAGLSSALAPGVGIGVGRHVRHGTRLQAGLRSGGCDRGRLRRGLRKMEAGPGRGPRRAHLGILPTAKARGFPSQTGLQRNFRPAEMRGLTLHRSAIAVPPRPRRCPRPFGLKRGQGYSQPR